MESSSTTTELIYTKRNYIIDYRSDYEVDFWREMKKRWMVVGVLCAVALAVLAPHFGAPGGFFHTEYTIYIPLSYIYYTAGRTRVHASRTRLYALTTLHAQVIAFGMSAVTVNALAVALDRRVIEGAMLASVARPCAWLPLSLSNNGVTPALAALNYAASFVFSPLAHLVLCGRIPVPVLKGVLISTITAIVPFTLGTLSQKSELETMNSKISALIILYTECCQLLREAEGSLYITDVIATLFLVISWLTTVAISSYLYTKCGMLTTDESQSLMLVSTPKSIHIEWISSTLCPASGLARLPAVFIAPAQALLLAAITTDSGDGGDDDELPR